MSAPPRQSAALARIAVRGRFGVAGACGHDLTPARRKERGLLALLALSPQRRRSRAWIKDKLWSERAPEQAASSLRRALCNLRKCLGPAAEGLASDRFEVWLTDAVEIDRRDDLGPEAELLETIDVPDPEFEDWLRDQRQSGPGTAATPAIAAPSAPVSSAGTLVSIRTLAEPSAPEEIFLTAFLTDALSSRLSSEGDAEVHVGDEPSAARIAAAGTFLRLEISSVMEGGDWHVHLRAFVDRNRRFLWSGRMVLPMDFRAICQGPEIAGFIGGAMSGIHGRVRALRLANGSAFLSLQRAAQRLFTGQRDEIRLADTELRELSGGEGAAIALAWRSFAQLTRALEFAEGDAGVAEAARCLAEEAAERAPTNPLVLGLASQVATKIDGDPDRGLQLALAGMRICDQNPFALMALSQAHLAAGAFAPAHEAALRARRIVQSMPNAFFWDLQAGLTALGVHDLPAAREAIAAACAKNPGYRPALRYRAAIGLIEGARAEAERHAAALARREPGFRLGHLAEPDYPVHTLRRTGYAEALAV